MKLWQFEKMILRVYSDLESCLLKWFYQYLNKKILKMKPILQGKAEEFGHKLGHEYFKVRN